MITIIARKQQKLGQLIYPLKRYLDDLDVAIYLSSST